MAKSLKPKSPDPQSFMRDVARGLAWITLASDEERPYRLSRRQRRQIRVATAWLTEQLDGMEREEAAYGAQESGAGEVPPALTQGHWAKR